MGTRRVEGHPNVWSAEEAFGFSGVTLDQVRVLRLGEQRTQRGGVRGWKKTGRKGVRKTVREDSFKE